MLKIKDYLQNNKPISKSGLAQLQQMVERYPYFHAVRLLYLRALYLNHDAQFGPELRKTAVSLPSRVALFSLIESERMNPLSQVERFARKNNSSKDTAQPVDDRTESLISDFLDSLPAEQEPTHTKRGRVADVRVDYMDYLMQTDPDSPVLGMKQLDNSTLEEDLIGKFLDTNAKLELTDRNDDELQKPQLSKENDEENDIFTETLAGIYIKQGKFDKALEIIRQLYLKNPKKSRYFADQVRFLEKLIVNNNNKK